MLTKTQSKLLPFLEEYEKVGEILCPYMMRTPTPNYASELLSTDGAGFRHTRVGDLNLSPLETKKLEKGSKVNIFLGSSSLFGIGSSENKFTIPSYLSNLGLNNPINYGIPAFNSTQELIAYLIYRPKDVEIERIIIFSGINNFTLKEIGKVALPNMNPLFNNDIITFNINRDKSFKLLTKTLIKKILAKVNIDQYSLSQVQNDKNTKKFNPINQTINDLQTINLISKGTRSKLYFFFQPLASLLGKELSSEEKRILDSLKSLNITTEFLNKKIISQYNKSIKLLEEYCKHESINYFNLNNELKINTKDWFFSDSIHLTDLGYKICSEFIASVL